MDLWGCFCLSKCLHCVWCWDAHRERDMDVQDETWDVQKREWWAEYREGKARGVSCLFTGSKPRMGIFAPSLPSILQLISPASVLCVKTMSYASLEIEIYTMVPEILLGSKFGDIIGQIQKLFLVHIINIVFLFIKITETI